MASSDFAARVERISNLADVSRIFTAIFDAENWTSTNCLVGPAVV